MRRQRSPVGTSAPPASRIIRHIQTIKAAGDLPGGFLIEGECPLTKKIPAGLILSGRQGRKRVSGKKDEPCCAFVYATKRRPAKSAVLCHRELFPAAYNLLCRNQAGPCYYVAYLYGRLPLQYICYYRRY
jgi:hypothetical protein